jgi:mevalonate kinase
MVLFPKIYLNNGNNTRINIILRHFFDTMLTSRHVTASAPGKIILFGEHAVVYGKPAIAAAVDRRVYVKVEKRDDNRTHVKVEEPEVSGFLNLEKGIIELENGKNNRTGILEYVLRSLIKTETRYGLEITINMDIPIGAGLGSSAAITVATIKAASTFNEIKLTRDEIAKLAHQVELEVQGSASPIDTTLSTHGGIIYLSRDAEEIIKLNINYEIPIVIGYTSKRGNTGELVESVRLKTEKHPQVMLPILNSMESITNGAREAMINGDQQMIGEFMNINHGLLDAIGVNTEELSKMVYTARKTGSLGSKLTGAGGGGSIIAYCPGIVDEVVSCINEFENAFKINISSDGVRLE